MLVVFPLISVQSSNDLIYTTQLKKCLKNIELVPKNISAVFDIKVRKNHLELVVHNDGEFDYYEMNWKGYCCYKATGLNEIPLRTDEEQEDCDK